MHCRNHHSDSHANHVIIVVAFHHNTWHMEATLAVCMVFQELYIMLHFCMNHKITAIFYTCPNLGVVTWVDLCVFKMGIWVGGMKSLSRTLKTILVMSLKMTNLRLQLKLPGALGFVSHLCSVIGLDWICLTTTHVLQDILAVLSAVWDGFPAQRPNSVQTSSHGVWTSVQQLVQANNK